MGPEGADGAHRAAPWHPHPRLSHGRGYQPPALFTLAPGIRPGCSSLHGWGSGWLLSTRANGEQSTPPWGRGRVGVPMLDLAQPLPGPGSGCSGQGPSRGSGPRSAGPRPPSATPGCHAAWPRPPGGTARPPWPSLPGPGHPQGQPRSPAAGGMRPEPGICPQICPSLGMVTVATPLSPNLPSPWVRPE